MPDLSHEASLQYWFEYIDPMIYRVIVFLESVEVWTLDGQQELEEAITKIGAALDDLEQVDLGRLHHEEVFIRLAANIKSGRGLRLLQAIDIAQPGSASKVLIHAEETTMGSHDPAGIFLKRNIAFERLRLIARVFSTYRLKLITRALEGEE